MCGIAGYIGQFTGPTLDDLKSMISQVRHRGPDGFGFFLKDRVGLAHARLSIIDTSSNGFQPIHNEDKTIWCVFNGEIFNYVELKETLIKKGHTFYTNTDTEVIVHAYEEWEEDFVHLLNGQFAIALYDMNKGIVFLYRDRVGICPLFYSSFCGNFYFGSEIKALYGLKSGNPNDKIIDASSLIESFSKWGVPNNTIYTTVKQIPEGCYGIIKLGTGTIHIKKYWNHNYSEDAAYRHDDIELLLEETLKQSIKIRLRSDVPLAMYLSGGLDSSIIAAMANQLVQNVRTFSIAFSDKEFDERPYQEIVAKHLGIHHTSFLCSQDEIVSSIEQCIYHTETPITRTASIPMMLLSGMVKKSGITCVLTGEGSDEAFGGYDIFREAKIRRMLIEDPSNPHIDTMLLNLYSWNKDLSQAKQHFNMNFGRHTDLSDPFFSHLPRWNTGSFIRNFMSSETIDGMVERPNLWEDEARWLYKTYEGMGKPHTLLQKSQYLEYHTLLANYLLSSQGDRMLMANAVEGRFPFLDHNVIQLANRLPDNMKIKDGIDEKWILKKVAIKYLPESIISRKKQPYRSPDAVSFFGKEFINDLLCEESIKNVGIFDYQKVSKIRDKRTPFSFRDNMMYVGILTTQILHNVLLSKEFKSTINDDEVRCLYVE